MKRISQNQKILKHLKSKKTITPMEALLFYQVYRLAARIKDLRDKGHKIHTEIKVDENAIRYARYTL